MSYQIFQLPKEAANFGAGFYVNFYLTGTTTQTDTYTTSALSTTHANPVVADSAGTLPVVYLDPSIVYKCSIYDADGVLQYTADPCNDLLVTQATVAEALFPQTTGEQAAAKTPSPYLYIPGDRDRGDIRRYGVTSASSSSAIANAVQDALSSHDYAFIPGDDWAWGAVVLSAARQRIYGDGRKTQLVLDGAITGIDFDGRMGCEVADLVLVSTNASAIGIDVGPNSGATRFAHDWSLKRVMACGNTTDWTGASEWVSGSRTGFAAAFQIETAFYGGAELCHAAKSAGYGFKVFNQANGNTFSKCNTRDCLTGLGIEGDGSGTGNTNGVTWEGGNIEASSANSVGISIKGADRNYIKTRMEISASGGTHLSVNPPVGETASQNSFDLQMTGTSAGAVIGDGTGSNQINGTRLNLPKAGASVTINADATGTVIEGDPTGFSGITFTDNGVGTIVLVDAVNSRWYVKNSTSKVYDLTAGGSTTREGLATNARTFSWTNLTDGVTFERVDIGGSTYMSVMRFGAYRIWISPTNGKVYVSGSTPTAHDNGTVVGTQT